MNYLEARKKWESIKDLRELNVFEYELIITALLERITQLEAAQQPRALDKVPVRLGDACPTCGGCDVQCAECLAALCQ